MIFKDVKKIWMIALMMAFVFAGSAVSAADYPTKLITIIVTTGAGGLGDITARLDGEFLERELGKPFKVICKPGGGNIPGVMSFLKEPADGYTMLRYFAASAVTNPLIRKTPYNPHGCHQLQYSLCEGGFTL